METDLIAWDAPRPEPPFNMLQPWQRQPCDDDAPWHAWRVYLMLSLPRSVKRVSQKTRIPQHILERWSQACSWRMRAMAYDNHIHQLWLDRVEQKRNESADDYVARHTRILRTLGELLERESEKYLDVSKRQDAIGLLRPEHLNALAGTIIKHERLVNDQSTDNVSVRGSIDLSLLSLDELKQFKQLNAKARVDDK